MLRPFRPRSGLPALVVILTFLFLSAGCVRPGQAAHEETAPRMEGRHLAGTAAPGETAGKQTEGESIPAEDTRGEPVPELPRYPGAVRVGYSEKEADGLTLVRATYLSEEGPDAVRGFYDGVFRAEGWQVANVEYSAVGWHFSVLRGVQEAGLGVSPRDGGSEVRIEISGPAGGPQASPAGGSKR